YRLSSQIRSNSPRRSLETARSNALSAGTRRFPLSSQSSRSTRNRSHFRFRGAQVVGRRQQDLRAASAGADRYHLEQLDGLIGERRVLLASAEHRDAAADVAGERLHFFQRDLVHLVLAQLVADAEPVENPRGVGLSKR